jgi:hypothetical protein
MVLSITIYSVIIQPPVFVVSDYLNAVNINQNDESQKPPTRYGYCADIS